MKFTKTIFFSVLLLSFSGYFCYGQNYNLLNNGYSIVINQNSIINIAGDYINQSSLNGNDGKIDLDGTIILKGNIVNNSNLGGNVFVNNPGLNPNGLVIMDALNNQYIEGTTPINFEALKLQNSKKGLLVSDCQVSSSLDLDAVFDLNQNNFIINNSSPNSLNYISGYLLSETTNDYGSIQWNIGDNLATYYLPFGTSFSANSDIPVTFTTKSAASPANGSVTFATWPTNHYNQPLHNNISYLPYSPEYIADRHWYIKPDYTVKPNVNISFSYTDDNVDQLSNSNITENELKAYRFNPVINSWTDISPLGMSDPANNNFAINNLMGSDFYSNWIIATIMNDQFVWIPSAFTPHSKDDHNDGFIPVLSFTPVLYSISIFDRWGKLVFQSNDYQEVWNGTSLEGNELPLGVYIYQLRVINEINHEFYKHGSITLI